MMNFVRAQIKKAADETETILETTPVGKSDGEGALRAFIKRQGQRLRRLSNLVSCRDPEYVSPERSRSVTPSDPTSGHGDPLEDEDVGVVTQEVADDMTLGTYQVRSADELKPRKGINKYTPEDFTQRGKRTVGTSRMAALDDYVDDVEEPEPEPERVALPRKAKKIASRRGGGAKKRTRN
ncbi:unnamed protein product [Triticum aestivum]|uniref:Uncharacterized protein n=1 Tax=Triticum aestivum TaxID=4565 RepID=A0A7H4LD42_WHEAT|nr:unnamed protein product [Triticum aestivum]